MADRTFEYLLNAFEQASQSPTPAQMQYAARRKAVLDHESELRAEVERLTKDLRALRASYYFAIDALDDEINLRRKRDTEVERLRDLLGRWNGFQAVAFIHTQKESTVSLIVDTARVLAPAVGHPAEKGAKP